jgi:hypothetical protein
VDRGDGGIIVTFGHSKHIKHLNSILISMFNRRIEEEIALSEACL